MTKLSYFRHPTENAKIRTQMSLIDILLPPALDPKQALRLRRFGLAALSYARSMALVAVAWRFGVMSAAAVIKIGV